MIFGRTSHISLHVLVIVQLILLSFDFWLINSKLLFRDQRQFNNSLHLKADPLRASCTLKVPFYKTRAIDNFSKYSLNRVSVQRAR